MSEFPTTPHSKAPRAEVENIADNFGNIELPPPSHRRKGVAAAVRTFGQRFPLHVRKVLINVKVFRAREGRTPGELRGKDALKARR